MNEIPDGKDGWIIPEYKPGMRKEPTFHIQDVPVSRDEFFDKLIAMIDKATNK